MKRRTNVAFDDRREDYGRRRTVKVEKFAMPEEAPGERERPTLRPVVASPVDDAPAPPSAPVPVTPTVRSARFVRPIARSATLAARIALALWIAVAAIVAASLLIRS